MKVERYRADLVQKIHTEIADELPLGTVVFREHHICWLERHIASTNLKVSPQMTGLFVF